MEAIETETVDPVRHARRAAELIQTATDVLREELEEHGAFARAVEKLERAARELLGEQSQAKVTAAHEALAHSLVIGRAVVSALEPRGAQCVETLAHAQRILYPVVRTYGPVPEIALDARRTEPRWEERRASPRVDIALEISFESDDNFYQGFSEDMSDGGLFIATYDLSPKGTLIDLEFTLPTGHIVKTVGEVRWLRDLRDECDGAPPGMGLAFRDLAPEDARAIHAYVQARAPIFYDD